MFYRIIYNRLLNDFNFCIFIESFCIEVYFFILIELRIKIRVINNS